MKATQHGLRWWAAALLVALHFLVPATAVCSDAEDGQTIQPPASRYVIQIGSFPRLTAAEDAVAMLESKGCDAYYRYENTISKGMWYRVYTGSFGTFSEARQAAAELQATGVIKAYLVKKVAAQVDPSPIADAAASATAPGGHLPQQEIPGSMTAADPAPAISVGAPPTIVRGASQGEREQEPEGPVVRLSLLEAIRYSLQGNREIKVTTYDPLQAQAEMESTQSVYDPLLFADTTYRRDPNLDSSVTDIVTEDDSRTRAGIRKPLATGGTFSTYLESRYGDLDNSTSERTYKHIVSPTVELQQPLLNNIGSRKEKTAIKIATYQANISSAELRRKVIEVTEKVATVYWRLFLYKELIDINRINLEMAAEVHRRESERYAGGLSQQLDVERALSNAQVRRSTWLRSREEYRLAMDRLKLLLNWGAVRIDSDVTVLPVESPRIRPMHVSESEAIETALANRPEIVKAREQLSIRDADQALADHQRLPKLDAFGRYSVSGYGDDFDRAWEDISVNRDDIWEVGIEFEWAFGNRLADSRYRKKTLGRKQADVQLKRIQEEIRLEVKEVLHRLATVEGEIEANRAAKQAAEKVVEGEFTRFDIGQTTNEELLRAQDLLAVASRSHARAVADYNTTIHELARVQGLLPDGITFEETPLASQ